MHSEGRTSVPARDSTAWTLLDAVFGLVVPGFCLIGVRALDRVSGDPGQPRLWFDAGCAFIVIEVVLFGAVRWFVPGLRARWPAFVSGALGMGSAFAMAIACLMVATAFMQSSVRNLLLLSVFSTIPIATAVVFARAARIEWRATRGNAVARNVAVAFLGAFATTAPVFFWPLSSRITVARALARLDRGGELALDDATNVFLHVPWADTTELVQEWRRRSNQPDRARIAQLFERVTGRDIASVPTRAAD